MPLGKHKAESTDINAGRRKKSKRELRDEIKANVKRGYAQSLQNKTPTKSSSSTTSSSSKSTPQFSVGQKCTPSRAAANPTRSGMSVHNKKSRCSATESPSKGLKRAPRAKAESKEQFRFDVSTSTSPNFPFSYGTNGTPVRKNRATAAAVNTAGVLATDSSPTTSKRTTTVAEKDYSDGESVESVGDRVQKVDSKPKSKHVTTRPKKSKLSQNPPARLRPINQQTQAGSTPFIFGIKRAAVETKGEYSDEESSGTTTGATSAKVPSSESQLFNHRENKSNVQQKSTHLEESLLNDGPCADTSSHVHALSAQGLRVGALEGTQGFGPGPAEYLYEGEGPRNEFEDGRQRRNVPLDPPETSVAFPRARSDLLDTVPPSPPRNASRVADFRKPTGMELPSCGNFNNLKLKSPDPPASNYKSGNSILSQTWTGPPNKPKYAYTCMTPEAKRISDKHIHHSLNDASTSEALLFPGEPTQETRHNRSCSFSSCTEGESLPYHHQTIEKYLVEDAVDAFENGLENAEKSRFNFKFGVRFFLASLPFALAAFYYCAKSAWEGFPFSFGEKYLSKDLLQIGGPVCDAQWVENATKTKRDNECFIDYPNDFFYPGDFMEDVDACEGKFRLCPKWGRCYGGKLRDCNDSGGDISDLVRFIPNESKDTCVPSPDVIGILKAVEDSILAMTASQMCKSSDMLGKEDVVWWGEDSFPLFNLEKVAHIMTKKTPMQMTPTLLLWLSPVFDPSRVKFGGSTGKEDDFEAIGLASAVSPNELPFALTCSMKLMMWDLVGFFGSLAASLASISFKLSWRFVVDHPFISICIGVLLKILHYVQVRRRHFQRIKELLSIVREAVYDRLSELEENVVYAALILRDDIGHELYPLFERDRLFLYQEVWPLVVAEIRADNRIRKFRKMANGKDLEHWEFDPQSKRSRRMRKSLGSKTPDRELRDR